MPNQSYSGIHGDPWHPCDICGWFYHVSQLSHQPGLNRGIIVCPQCRDNPLTYYRDILIQENLTFGDDEAAVADILKEPTGDDSPVF
jgi:hypothetical protein